MTNLILKEHQNNYQNERNTRWAMENIHGEKIINVLIEQLKLKLPFVASENFKHQRLDELWFEKYSPHKYNWVKGCPDFCISMSNKETRHLHVELKIKDSGVFRKTLTGGVSKYGSIVPNYGCESFYLDMNPVYKNMNDFCIQSKLSTDNFLILFSKSDASIENMYVITLSQINDLIKNGWNTAGKNIPIAEFGEGYGKKTYLIPVEATKKLSSLDKNLIVNCLSIEKTIPH